jgi:hypothetical protein
MQKTDLILYLISFLLGGTDAWFISRRGKALVLLDMPNDRSSHISVIQKGSGFGLLGWFASAGDADRQIITL